MDMDNNSRRAFLKTFAFGVGAIALSPFMKIQSAFAALIKDTDPMVKTMGFFFDVRKDAKKLPKNYVKGSNCANCVLYPDPKAKLAKCPLFQSGEVPANGWCNSYNARPKAAPAKKA